MFHYCLPVGCVEAVICSVASIRVAVHRPLNPHFCDCTQHSSFLEMLPSSKLYDILATVRSVISESVCSHWSNITENVCGVSNVILLTSYAGLFYNRCYRVKLEKSICFLMGLFYNRWYPVEL